MATPTSHVTSAMMVGRCRQKVAPLGGIDGCIVQRPGSGTGLPQPPQRYLPQRPRRRSPGGRNRPAHIQTPGRERRLRRLLLQQLRSPDRHAWGRRPATPPPVPTSGRLDRRRQPARPNARPAHPCTPLPERHSSLGRRPRRLDRRLRRRAFRRPAEEYRQPPPRSPPR